MSTYLDMTKTIGDQLVDGLKQFEERSVSALSSFGEVASKLMPELPADVTLPDFVTSLPSASEIVAANFAVIERVMKAQKAVLLSLIEAVPAPAAASVTPKKKAAAKA